MRKSIPLLITVILISLVILAACATPAPQPIPTPATKPAPTQAPTPVRGGKMVISFGRPATSFGYPPKISGANGTFSRPFFERLMAVDDNGAYVPELATSWDIAPDGKSITFKLRQGVKFHDGTDFNADAIKFNYAPFLPPKSSSIMAGVGSIDVVDNYTVRFNLPNYNNLIMYQLATDKRFGIASPTAIEKNGEDWATTNPVGTGPFKLKQFERNVSVKYVKNPDYWDKNLPYLDEMEFIAIPDPMTQLSAFKAGEINVVTDARLEIVDQLKKEGYQVVTAPATLQSITMDTNHPDSVFANQKVREAIEYAIDKEAIVNGPALGLYKSAYQIVMTTSPDFNSACPPRKYDPAKAKQLLTEAGYPNGFSFKLSLNETEWQDLWVAVQSYLSKVGITMEIVKLDQAAYTTTIRTGSRSEKNVAAQATMEIRGNNLFMFDQYLRSNTTNYKDTVKPAGLDDLINQAIAARDNQTKTKLNQQIVKSIYDNASFIPLWIPPRVLILDKYTQEHGFYLNGDTEINNVGRISWIKK